MAAQQPQQRSVRVCNFQIGPSWTAAAQIAASAGSNNSSDAALQQQTSGGAGSSSTSTQRTKPPLALRLPFARISPFPHLQTNTGGGNQSTSTRAGGVNNNSEDAKFLNWLDSMAADEAAAGADARLAALEGPAKHDNAWYAARCVVCAACRTAIDAELGRRGAHCSGCRRWFHARCNPAKTEQQHQDGNQQQEQQQHQTPAAAAAAASSSGASGGRLFFHSRDCERGYRALQQQAAKGQQPVAPAQRGGDLFGGLFANLFGGRAGAAAAAEVPEEERLTVRLIDLAEARQQYKSLQRSGLLRARRDRLLEGAGLTPPKAAKASGQGLASSEDAGGSEDGGEEAVGGGGDVRRRGGGGSPVDDFIVAAELLTRQWPDDTVSCCIGFFWVVAGVGGWVGWWVICLAAGGSCFGCKEQVSKIAADLTHARTYQRTRPITNSPRTCWTTLSGSCCAAAASRCAPPPSTSTHPITRVSRWVALAQIGSWWWWWWCWCWCWCWCQCFTRTAHPVNSTQHTINHHPHLIKPQPQPPQPPQPHQMITSAEGCRRQGHAAALLGELHGMLSAAGLARVVAIIADVRGLLLGSGGAGRWVGCCLAGHSTTFAPPELTPSGSQLIPPPHPATLLQK